MGFIASFRPRNSARWVFLACFLPLVVIVIFAWIFGFYSFAQCASGFLMFQPVVTSFCSLTPRLDNCVVGCRPYNRLRSSLSSSSSSSSSSSYSSLFTSWYRTCFIG